MYRRTGWLLTVVLAIGCDDAEPPAPPPPIAVEEPAARSPTWADLVAASDRRELDESHALAARDPDARRRRAAMVSVGRLHDASPEAVEILRGGLRDPDPSVREAASMGLAAFGLDAPTGTDAALAGALAAESDSSVRAALVRDLGRLATDRALGVLFAELRAEATPSRAAACLGIAERALASRPVSREIRGRMASLLDPSEPEPVRFACAYGLARVPPTGGPDELRGEAVALGVSVGDESARVRVQAYRALARVPGVDVEMLAHGTVDPDWQVRVQAFRALGTVAATDEGGGRALARALRVAFEALVGGGAIRPGGPLHTLLAGIEAARPVARAGPVHELATELLGTVDGLTGGRDRALVHCALAELVDRSRGWPSRIALCGGVDVSEAERGVLEAGVLGDLEGAEAQRMVRLRRLFEQGSPSVRQAVVTAASRLVHVEANELILDALAVDDAGVRASALEALQTVAGRRPTEAVVPPPLPADRTRDALRALREATPDDEHETLVTWVGAVEATGVRELSEPLQGLGRHENRGVRDRARALLRAWELEVPTEHAPILHPIEAAELVDPATRPRVRVQTSRGPVVIELRPDEAPTTVSRFLGLVRAGYFDGLTFHRVVPGFVVQGGDPRGDGYGGPGWAQRCEDNRLSYDRGAVGMALAGRDTGGAQFFITHGPQPHLEGRYTAFGQVVEGMEAVDALQRGDQMQSAIEIVSN